MGVRQESVNIPVSGGTNLVLYDRLNRTGPYIRVRNMFLGNMFWLMEYHAFLGYPGSPSMRGYQEPGVYKNITHFLGEFLQEVSLILRGFPRNPTDSQFVL